VVYSARLQIIINSSIDLEGYFDYNSEKNNFDSDINGDKDISDKNI
jgi:hypothetical protein